MRVGYSKIGRSWNLDPANWSNVGGDVDSARLLMRLALKYPQHQFVLVGRNSGEDPQSIGYPANVINPWHTEGQRLRMWQSRKAASGEGPSIWEHIALVDEITGMDWENCDQHIVWAGQHGTSQTPIPPVGKDWTDELTNPQDAFVNYGAYLVRGLSRWRSRVDGHREEVWLCSDPRNYVKARDLKWPLRHPVLAQFDRTWAMKHERFQDERTPSSLGFEAEVEKTRWVCKARYAYSGLELTACLPPDRVPVATTPGPCEFGMMVNENRRYVKNPRGEVIARWVMPYWPDCEMYGKWSDAGKEDLGRDVADPVPVLDVFDTLRRFRSTLTTPASGSGWATAKPWECFAAGTVCFFHPAYDTQGHIVPTAEQVAAGKVRHDPELEALAQWLRTETPEQLHRRVQAVAQDDATWAWISGAQRRLFERRFAEDQIGTMIADRLGLDNAGQETAA